MQKTFSNPDTLGHAGQIAYPLEGFSKRSILPGEYINFGDRLAYSDSNRDTVYRFGTNKITLTNSGNLDASDTYSFTLKIYDIANRTETEHSITETYDTSDAATMGAIVTALEALTGINDAGTLYGTPSNVLTIVAEAGYLIEVTDEETGGGSSVTITKANLNTLTAAGFASYSDKEPFSLDNADVSMWKPSDEIMGNIVKGTVIVESVTGFSFGDSLYVVGYGADRGKINNAAGENSIAITDVTIVKGASASGKGIVSINI